MNKLDAWWTEKKYSDSEMLPINQARDKRQYIFYLAYQRTQS